MPPSQRSFHAPDAQGGNTHRIAYTEWGDPDNPRVLVCMHGLTRNSRDFDFLARSLNQNYRIICPDMPGRGQSDYFTDAARYNYGTYLADTLALLKHLGIQQCNWVGTSMGGIIGMMVASFYPNLIAKLVLNDIGPFISKAGLMRIINYVSTVPVFDDEATAQTYLRDIFAPFGITSEAQWQHLFAHGLRQNAHGKITLAYDPTIIEPFKIETKNFTEINDIDLWSLWEGVICPTLILRGETSDILTHDVAEKMQTSKPGVTLVEFPSVGHAPALMDPAQIQVVKEWLLKD